MRFGKISEREESRFQIGSLTRLDKAEMTFGQCKIGVAGQGTKDCDSGLVHPVADQAFVPG